MLVQVEIRPNDAVLRLMECRATVRPVAPLGVRDRAATGGFDELGRVPEQTESGGCRVVIERQGDEKGCQHPAEAPSLVSGTSTRSASE